MNNLHVDRDIKPGVGTHEAGVCSQQLIPAALLSPADISDDLHCVPV